MISRQGYQKNDTTNLNNFIDDLLKDTRWAFASKDFVHHIIQMDSHSAYVERDDFAVTIDYIIFSFFSFLPQFACSHVLNFSRTRRAANNRKKPRLKADTPDTPSSPSTPAGTPASTPRQFAGSETPRVIGSLSVEQVHHPLLDLVDANGEESDVA